MATCKVDPAPNFHSTYYLNVRCLQRGIVGLLIVCFLAIGTSTGWAASPYTTQAFDNGRSNWNPTETGLTVSNVRSSFGPWFKLPLDAQVYAQPLYLPALNMGSSLGTHNVLFVATESNTVYAFDADGGKQLWKVGLTPSGETLQVSSDYNNTRVPHIGITATPVIDPGTNTIYLVAATKTVASPVVYHQRLHALDVTTGHERTGSPVDIRATYRGTGGTQDGNGNVVFDPRVQFNRASLLLFNGLVWTAFGSHEDVGTYQGWVIAYDKTTLQRVGVFNTAPDIPNGSGGASVWQSDMGLAADSNSTYFLTANGTFDADTGGHDYSDTAIRLGTNFQVLDYFTPCNQQELDDLNVDLGSGGPMILPAQSSGSPPNLITFAGKEGSVYLADRTNMGKYTPTTVPDNQECEDKVVQELWRVLGIQATNGNASRDAFWGAPAYFRDASGNQTIYYAGNGNSIRAYALANGAMAARTVNGGADQTPDTYVSGGTVPAISSNASTAGSAILWAIKRAASAEGNGPLKLEAYDATNLTDQIVTDLPAGNWSELNYAFLTPTVANGKVYVASDGELDAFALTSSASEPVKITGPANGAAVSGTVSIQTQASSQVLWVNVYIDGKILGASPPYTFSWDSTSVPNGQHTISAAAFDRNDNQIGADSIAVVVSNGAARILSPTNGATVFGTVSIQTQVSSQVLWENVYIDGKHLASSPPYTFSWDSTTVADGSHTISIKAYDKNGTQIGAASVTVKVGNSAAKILSPVNGATVSGTVSIQTQVSSQVLWENVYIDGKHLASSPPYTFSWNSTTVPNGQHVISVKAFDRSNALIGGASVTVTVKN